MHCGYVETYFSQEIFSENGAILTLEAHHAPLSIDIATNAPNFEGVCFVTNGDENELVQEKLDCLEQTSSGAYQLMKKIFSDIFQSLETNKNVKEL